MTVFKSHIGSSLASQGLAQQQVDVHISNLFIEVNKYMQVAMLFL